MGASEAMVVNKEETLVMLPSGLKAWGQINVKYRHTGMHTDTCYLQACRYGDR